MGENLVCFEILMKCRCQKTPNFSHLDETKNSNCHLEIGEIVQIKMGKFFETPFTTIKQTRYTVIYCTAL